MMITLQMSADDFINLFEYNEHRLWAVNSSLYLKLVPTYKAIINSKDFDIRIKKINIDPGLLNETLIFLEQK